MRKRRIANTAAQFDFTGGRKTGRKPAAIRIVRRPAFSRLLLDRWLALLSSRARARDFIRGCVLDEKPVDGDQRASERASERAREHGGESYLSVP